MALSETSNTMWWRPDPSSVSPIYMPGRLRTASRPLRTLMLLAPYSSAPFGSSVPSFIRCFQTSWLNAHRHDDVAVVAAIRERDEHAAVGVAECAIDARARDVGQDIEEVGD